MRLIVVGQIAVFMIAGLLVGCGPKPPSGVDAATKADANAPVSAELDNYMKDGNVIVEAEPMQSFKALVDMKKGSALSRETTLEIWTRTNTVSFVRDTPEGKLFKVDFEVRSPTNKLGPSGTSYYLLAHDGLHYSNVSGAKGGSPSIPTEIAVGKEWSDGPEGSTPGSDKKRFYKVEAKETVEVPAGKFEAYRIVSGIAAHPGVSKIWYTPGVGIVKYGEGRGRELKEIKVKK